jgi:hypothetical protein
VWTFGHSVREIERSHHEVVVEEAATKGALIEFGAFALLDLVSFRKARGQALAVGVALGFLLAGLALYAAISSSFVGRQKSPSLDYQAPPRSVDLEEGIRSQGNRSRIRPIHVKRERVVRAV